MATKTTKPQSGATVPVGKSTKSSKAAAAAPAKPIKESLSKTGLVAHLAQVTSMEPKAIKSVLAALETSIVMSLNKKGAGTFTLPGLLKITSVAVPAKKKRVGIDPFTKQERTFAAKPATVKIKVRALKKLKDAAL